MPSGLWAVPGRPFRLGRAKGQCAGSLIVDSLGCFVVALIVVAMPYVATAAGLRRVHHDPRRPKGPVVLTTHGERLLACMALHEPPAEFVPALTKIEGAPNFPCLGGAATNQASIMRLRRPPSVAFCGKICAAYDAAWRVMPEVFARDFQKGEQSAAEELRECYVVAGKEVPPPLTKRIQQLSEGKGNVLKREVRASATPLVKSAKALEDMDKLSQAVFGQSLGRVAAPVFFLHANRHKDAEELKALLDAGGRFVYPPDKNPGDNLDRRLKRKGGTPDDASSKKLKPAPPTVWDLCFSPAASVQTAASAPDEASEEGVQPTALEFEQAASDEEDQKPKAKPQEATAKPKKSKTKPKKSKARTKDADAEAPAEPEAMGESPPKAKKAKRKKAKKAKRKDVGDAAVAAPAPDEEVPEPKAKPKKTKSSPLESKATPKDAKKRRKRGKRRRRRSSRRSSSGSSSSSASSDSGSTASDGSSATVAGPAVKDRAKAGGTTASPSGSQGSGSSYSEELKPAAPTWAESPSDDSAESSSAEEESSAESSSAEEEASAEDEASAESEASKTVRFDLPPPANPRVFTLSPEGLVWSPKERRWKEGS